MDSFKKEKKTQNPNSLGMYCVKILFQTILKTMGQILESLLLLIFKISLMHKVNFNTFSYT